MVASNCFLDYALAIRELPKTEIILEKNLFSFISKGLSDQGAGI